MNWKDIGIGLTRKGKFQGKVLINSKKYSEYEYDECVEDILTNDMFLKTHKYMQHGDISCLEHCIYVSYVSYGLSKKFGLDYKAAARGGLLHDFFMYDWHGGQRPYKGLHGFHHPRIAFENASKYFTIGKKEKDIILKHMWPLTLRIPRFKETLVVLAADKYCTVREVFRLARKDIDKLNISRKSFKEE